MFHWHPFAQEHSSWYLLIVPHCCDLPRPWFALLPNAMLAVWRETRSFTFLFSCNGSSQNHLQIEFTNWLCYDFAFSPDCRNVIFVRLIFHSEKITSSQVFGLVISALDECKDLALCWKHYR